MAELRRTVTVQWWRLQSPQQMGVDATPRADYVSLTVTRVGLPGVQLLSAVEARYYGVDRPKFGTNGQIRRVDRCFQLDVLTNAQPSSSWVPLTGSGDTKHPPDDYGPGTTLAVWRCPAGAKVCSESK